MKKILLFIISMLSIFILISCKEKNPINMDEKDNIADDEINGKETICYIYLEGLDDVYLKGEEADILIKSIPNNLQINKVKYESSNEEILVIDNNGHLKALKEGKVLITITINEKEEKRIIEVLEDELARTSQQENDEFEKLMQQKREEREQEAKEHGFDTYKEYRVYLDELAFQERIKNAKEKYDSLMEIANSLGISYEDYLCLRFYNKTFDEMKEMKARYGYDFEVAYFEGIKDTFIEYKIDDEESFDKRAKLSIEQCYISVNLGYFENEYSYINDNNVYVTAKEITYYSQYYRNVVLWNNFGSEINQEAWKKIEEVLPGADEYKNMYDYLTQKVDQRKASAYIKTLLRGPFEYSGLTNEDIKYMIELLEEYDK